MFLVSPLLGPGTRLQEKIHSCLAFRSSHRPVNRVDAASYRHDVGYFVADQIDDLAERHRLDLDLLDDMDSILETSSVGPSEKAEAMVVKVLMSIKCAFR